jgi:hypothetical protein
MKTQSGFYIFEKKYKIIIYYIKKLKVFFDLMKVSSVIE